MRAIPILLAALLAAAAPAAARQDREVLTVVGFGDSTTAFRKGIDAVWPRRLQRLLEARGTSALVVNAGAAGDTTRSAAARFEREVLGHRPQLVVIQFGLNDSVIDFGAEPPAPVVPLEEYTQRLAGFVEAVRAAGAEAVLMTPNPGFWTRALRKRYGRAPYDPEDPWGFNLHNARYAQAVRDLAARMEVPLVDVYRAYESLDRQDPGAARRLLPDGLHPYDAGHAMVAERLADRVASLQAAERLRPRPLAEPELQGEPVVLVEEGEPVRVHFAAESWRSAAGVLAGTGYNNALFSALALGAGDFRMRAWITLPALEGSAASFQIGHSWFGFDGVGRYLYLNGPLFGGGVKPVGPNAEVLLPAEPFLFELERAAGQLRFAINGAVQHTVFHEGPVRRFGFLPVRARLELREWTVQGNLVESAAPMSAGYSIPIVDISAQEWRRVVVDREPGQYLGHPTTVLLEDGRTMFCVYPQGHGRGPIVMRRSNDGGKTWSPRIPVPANWATSQETPTIHRVTDPQGVKRLILFSGLYPIRMAVSEDDGRSWTPLEPIGDFGGIVAMAALERTRDGRYLAWFHDDGRFLHGGGERGSFQVFQVESADGGLSWSAPRVIAEHPEAHLCEPGVVRSPDGKRLALLLRENSRQFNSFVIFSDDEGASWSAPRELPAALTGDRHTGRYAPDGRLFLSFRDTTRSSTTAGDWVGWVGTWADLEQGREGQYRVRILDNTLRADCAYPGVELLPDGTVVTTTYGHWTAGEPPYVVNVRFRLGELDALLPPSR